MADLGTIGIDRRPDAGVNRKVLDVWAAKDIQSDDGRLAMIFMGSLADAQIIRQRMVIPNLNNKSITVEVQIGGTDAVRDVLLIERNILRHGIRRKTTGADGLAVFDGLVPDRIYLAIALDDADDPQFNDLISEQEVGV